MVVANVPPFNGLIQRVDEGIYDWLYKHRPVENKLDAPVVMICVDDYSVDQMENSESGLPWPWPRDWWAGLIPWLEKCGAKVVVFDLLFDGKSPYNHYVGDDRGPGWPSAARRRSRANCSGVQQIPAAGHVAICVASRAHTNVRSRQS